MVKLSLETQAALVDLSKVMLVPKTVANLDPYKIILAPHTSRKFALDIWEVL